ncbi:MAG TPA: prenyltransferase [Spirochaetaceae bacterium]|jgi:1,4-dihydroxy-2-naphthoate octaprenyltransferase|nr:prenyltransferase [Spirochaetaceae bacterium]
MTFKQFAGVVELRTKIVSLSTFGLSLLYALWLAGGVSPARALLVLAAALAVDMGTTGFNSYFDWYRNVDDARFNREEAKVLVHEGVSPGSALLVSMLCYAAAAIIGLALAFIAGPAVLAIGGASLLAGFLYSGGPRPLSSTPLGELFAGGFLGAAFFAVSVFILTGRLDGPTLLASIPQSLFIGAILSVNNACDFVGDKAAGRRTLAIALGQSRAALPVYAQLLLGALSLAALSAAALLPRAMLVPLALALALAIRELALMRARGYSHDTKGLNMGGISKIFLFLSAAQALGYLLAIVLG